MIRRGSNRRTVYDLSLLLDDEKIAKSSLLRKLSFNPEDLTADTRRFNSEILRNKRQYKEPSVSLSRSLSWPRRHKDQRHNDPRSKVKLSPVSQPLSPSSEWFRQPSTSPVAQPAGTQPSGETNPIRQHKLLRMKRSITLAEDQADY